MYKFFTLISTERLRGPPVKKKKNARDTRHVFILFVAMYFWIFAVASGPRETEFIVNFSFFRTYRIQKLTSRAYQVQ